MKVYFDRTEPYYYSREPTFDGIAVDVPENIMTLLDDRKDTLAAMDRAIENAGAPEDSAEDLSQLFVQLLVHEQAKAILRESDDGTEPTDR